MKILVVLDQDLEQSDQNSLLIRKATMLANGLGASLELLQIVYDPSLERSLFLQEKHLQAARAGLLAEAGERLSSLTESLHKRGLSVRFDVRWDHPRAAAIVRKIAEDNFDWVIKQAKDEHSRLGLFSNTDWELLRDSPVPVYFVKGANPPGAGVLVALEGFASEAGSQAARLDYDVYRHGRRMAETFDTPLTVVHAYQVPRDLSSFAGYSLIADTPPAPAALATLTESERKEQQEVAAKHAQAIRAFAEYFAYPVADIVVREGLPDTIISNEAHLRQSGLVVMGAGKVGRLDRLFRKVTAEPTLAEADCDILFVKPAPLPTAAPAPAPAEPRKTLQFERSQCRDLPNLAKILADPASAYDTPLEAAVDKRFTVYERRRILRAWEHDLQESTGAAYDERQDQESDELKAIHDALKIIPHREPS